MKLRIIFPVILCLLVLFSSVAAAEIETLRFPGEDCHPPCFPCFFIVLFFSNILGAYLWLHRLTRKPRFIFLAVIFAGITTALIIILEFIEATITHYWAWKWALLLFLIFPILVNYLMLRWQFMVLYKKAIFKERISDRKIIIIIISGFLLALLIWPLIDPLLRRLFPFFVPLCM